MKILKLVVSNLLRIRAAEVIPDADGSLVVVAGRNDQGKSSLLNAIALALSGKDLPVQPIHSGAASGYVILETDELVVTRRFSQTAGTTLEIRDRDGAKITSPQSKLDALVSRTTFDPFEFTRMEPKKQLETVKLIAGLDFTDLEGERSDKYAERTNVGRQVKDQDGKLRAITRAPDAPSEEVSVAQLMEELEAANEVNRVNSDKREKVSEMNDELEMMDERAKIAAQAVVDAQTALEKIKQSGIELAAKRDQAKKDLASLIDLDTAAISQKIRESEGTNAKVRANRQWNEEHKALIALQNKQQALTARIEAIDKEKAEKLEAAEFPVPGLGFSDTGVTFKGLPFEQTGTAMKMRVSVAIARSLNPKLPVMLVRDASLMDPETLFELKTEAEKHNLQVWIEVVGSPADATVVIEDGEVIATPAADAKKTKKPKKE